MYQKVSCIFIVLFLLIFSGCSKNLGGCSKNLNLLAPDDQAPDFTALTHEGKEITLSQLEKKGPVVLILVRNFL